MENIFPFIQPQVVIENESIELPLYKEIAWDFKKNIPIFRNGSPLVIEGKEAVHTWAWKTLNTERFKHIIYTWNYGNEVNILIGQPYTADLKIAEAKRYIEECLLINPYITRVTNIDVSFDDDTIAISCSLDTIYGDIDINKE